MHLMTFKFFQSIYVRWKKLQNEHSQLYSLVVIVQNYLATEWHIQSRVLQSTVW